MPCESPDLRWFGGLVWVMKQLMEVNDLASFTPELVLGGALRSARFTYFTSTKVLFSMLPRQANILLENQLLLREKRQTIAHPAIFRKRSHWFRTIGGPGGLVLDSQGSSK